MLNRSIIPPIETSSTTPRSWPQQSWNRDERLTETRKWATRFGFPLHFLYDFEHVCYLSKLRALSLQNGDNKSYFRERLYTFIKIYKILSKWKYYGYLGGLQLSFFIVSFFIALNTYYMLRKQWFEGTVFNPTTYEMLSIQCIFIASLCVWGTVIVRVPI